MVKNAAARVVAFGPFAAFYLVSLPCLIALKAYWRLNPK